ncbi:MAG: NYN domain-containing protein [Dehalococcoidia bacterium]|nr:NYN domain-containing protein [Dehalococcoidia bacterium]
MRMPELTTELVIQKAQDWYEHEFRRFHQLRKSVFEEIQQNTNFLEFKYVGQYVVQPFRPYRLEYDYDGNINFQGTQVGEKGVDIGIAVDMISKMDSFDVAVLVSGDSDFFPVVRYLKDKLKYVYHFSVGRGVGQDTQYFSPALRGVVDCFQGFDELELLSNYINEHAGIPPAIMDTINLRAAELERILDDEELSYRNAPDPDTALIPRR